LTIEAQLAGVEEIDPQYYVVKFICPPIAERAQPGQFVHVRVSADPAPLLRRPFSIMRADPRQGAVWLVVKVVGRGTKILTSAEPGAPFSMIGPLGNTFPLPRPDARVFLVAGGVGVAPLIFLADVLRAARRYSDITLIQGAARKNGLVHWAEFEAFVGPDFHFHYATEDQLKDRRSKGLVSDPRMPTVRREQPRLLTTGEPGMGHLAKRPPLCDADIVYACGPTAMMAWCAHECASCKDGSVPCFVSMEERMACGVGACLGCVVPVHGKGYARYARVCRDGPVFRAAEIDWEAMRIDLG